MSQPASRAMPDHDCEDLRRLAREHWAAGRFDAAINTAWAAYDLAPHDRRIKVLLAKLLHHFPAAIAPERRSALLRLLQDQEVAPDYISTAGWHLLLHGDGLGAHAVDDPEFEALAAGLHGDA